MGERYLDVGILENNPGYVKDIVRHWKHDMLDKLLDRAHHNRYWVIRFNEEWVDAERTWLSGDRRITIPTPRPGDKVVRLYGSIMEAQTERFVVPEMPLMALPDVRYVKYTPANYRLVLLVLFLVAMFVLTVALLANL